MKSKTIQKWQKVLMNPPEEYVEFFKVEEDFLKKNIKKEDVVLDIGCGNGRVMKILSGISKKVYGIDNDESAVELCKDNLKGFENVEVSLQDAEKINFKDGFFDVVICSEVFVNFGKTKFKILSEIKRVLKENSFLILNVYNEKALEKRLKMYKEHGYPFIKSVDEENGTVIFDGGVVSEQYSEEQITKILEDAGFEIQELIKTKIFYLIKAKKK